MQIVVDTREQAPYSFANFPGVELTRGNLETGDYSIVGFEDRVAIERKTVDDLVCCLSKDRERFERELCRARNYEHFTVVIEASLPPIMAGRYRSLMKSNSILQSIAAFSIRYHVPFLFCGDRLGGELMTYSLLSKYTYEITRRFERLHQEKKGGFKNESE